MLWAGALALLRRIDGFGPVRALRGLLGGRAILKNAGRHPDTTFEEAGNCI